MAQKKATTATSRKLGDKNAKNTAASRRKQVPQQKATIIDDRSRRDIWGIILIIVAIALFVAALLPTNAVVTLAIYNGLHLGFGIGCYLLPIFVLGIGVTFLVKSEKERLSARVAIGLLIIFIALLGLLALLCPAAQANAPEMLFRNEYLVGFGGYIGAGIAFAGMSLFGQIISVIILVGVIIVGLIIIGVSVSGFIERIRSGSLHSRNDAESDQFAPFARIGRVEEPANGQVPLPNVESEARTVVMPERKLKRSAKGESESATLVMQASGDDSPADAAGKQPITRKLGDKPRKDAPSQKDPSPQKDAAKAARLEKIKKMPVLPLAAPVPLEGFELPPMEILNTSHEKRNSKSSEEALRHTAELLQGTLEDFGVFATVAGWVAGPTVTLFKVELPNGVRVSKVTALNDDIALALAATGVRIFAPIPGTNYVGIEVPNSSRESVLLGDIIKQAKPGPLQMCIGKDVDGKAIISDLASMPHLLIGGTTGSGKTIAIHSMIVSILMRATPAEVRFIMIDPKRVEFMRYNDIPHLYVPVVTEAKEASSALAWGVAEMERRLKLFSKCGASNIGQFNAKVQNGLLENEAEVPYIVIIIDELADLMMNCGKEVEYSISRIAQLARAAGIHLIVATQRPSANVVTGLIKANITNRIALTVASGIDSRVILDSPGAEHLIGKGDMLYSKPEYPKPQRLQGCFVSDEETYAVVECIKEQGEPDYHTEILQMNMFSLGSSEPDGSGGTCTTDDPLLWEAADVVVSSNLGSTSSLQRRLKVGYARAGRIMDMLEEKGVVGPANGSKPREVLVDTMELEALKAFERQDAE